MVISSNTVLWGQALIYTLYVSAIMLLMIWFSLNITRSGKSKVNPKFFYSFVALLVTIGASLHVITYNTIPWTKIDLDGGHLVPDQSFNIIVANHKFQLPSESMNINCDKLTEFNVISEDLTYGFGVFRSDNTMVFQMQVVPGHDNIIKWKFPENGDFTIRSTEYSGPEGAQMILKNVIHVSGCAK